MTDTPRTEIVAAGVASEVVNLLAPAVLEKIAPGVLASLLEETLQEGLRLDANGHLVLSLAGKSMDLGKVRGEDGRTGKGIEGRRGPRGQRGRPGDSIVDAAVSENNELMLQVGGDGDEAPRLVNAGVIRTLRGIPGIRGPQGEVGPVGPRGEAGPNGPEGKRGPCGLQGQAGAQGFRGDTGARGAKGEDGKRGSPGVQGAQGPVGPAGERGPAGAEGKRGPRGGKGESVRGEAGPRGAPGWGFKFQGAWKPSQRYCSCEDSFSPTPGQADVVRHKGKVWVCMISTEVEPSDIAVEWGVLLDD